MNDLNRIDLICRAPPWHPVLHDHIGVDTAADIEFGAQAQVAGLAGGHKVIEYPVGDIFVKCAFIAI